MSEVDDKKDDEASIAKPVVRRVLQVFVKSLAKEEGMAEVAGRLQATLLDEGIQTEVAIRNALFGPSAT